MSPLQQVIAGKVVPFSQSQVEEAAQAPISERVRQIVVASGVPGLQLLISTPSARVAAVKLYWKRG